MVHRQVHTLAHASPNPSKSGWVVSDTVLTSQAFPSLLPNAQRAPPGPGRAGAGEAQGSNAEKAGNAFPDSLGLVIFRTLAGHHASLQRDRLRGEGEG